MDRTNRHIFAATPNVALRRFAEQLAERDQEIARLRGERIYLISLLRTAAKQGDCEATVNRLLAELAAGRTPNARQLQES